MISARLMKELERKGFELDFPAGSNEQKIIEILKEKNERFYAAIPLLLIEPFDYDKIMKRLKDDEKKIFHKILNIAEQIFFNRKIDNKIKDLIKEKSIKEKFDDREFDYYYTQFLESIKRQKKISDKEQEKDITIRSKLNINQSLSTIFAPGKRRIMKKIYNHEPLTDTELKYYYRSIRPFIHAIRNENLRKYLDIIDKTKKYKD